MKAAVLLLFLFCLAEADDLREEVKAMFQRLKISLEKRLSNLEAQNAAHGAQSNVEARLTAVEGKVKELYQFCPNGWKKFGPSCYYVTTEDKSWQEGRAECQSYGADLAIVNSKEEQDFIRGLRTGDSSWIGLSRTSTWGAWTWVDGSPLTPPTVYWYRGYPRNGGDQNCVLYFHNTDPGTWIHYGGCSYTAPSICER